MNNAKHSSAVGRRDLNERIGLMGEAVVSQIQITLKGLEQKPFRVCWKIGAVDGSYRE